MTARAQELGTALGSAGSGTGKPLQDKHTNQRRRGAILDVLAHAQRIARELLVSLKSLREFPPIGKLSPLNE